MRLAILALAAFAGYLLGYKVADRERNRPQPEEPVQTLDPRLVSWDFRPRYGTGEVTTSTRGYEVWNTTTGNTTTERKPS